MLLLGTYRKSLILIGGNVPPLLCPEVENQYIGTFDIDILMDQKSIDDDSYNKIENLLLNKGYKKHELRPNTYRREVTHSDGSITVVLVDFLASPYGGTGESHRHQQIQDIKARKLQGADFVLRNFTIARIEGTLPDGGHDAVEVRIADTVSFIILKGLALSERLKEKDSYDIYFCIKYYPGGIDSLVEQFMPMLNDNLVKKALNAIAAKFQSINHVGPLHAAQLSLPSSDEELQMIKRDSFEHVNALLKKLGIIF
jgi:hypothetical protein